MSRNANNLLSITALDMVAVQAIAASGFLGVDHRGQPFLEGERQIGPSRMKRLKEHGFIAPGGDGLFPGSHQTFQLTRSGQLLSEFAALQEASRAAPVELERPVLTRSADIQAQPARRGRRAAKR